VSNERMGSIPKLLPIEQEKKDKKAREWGVKIGGASQPPRCIVVDT
jgi:hypothetical protein